MKENGNVKQVTLVAWMAFLTLWAGPGAGETGAPLALGAADSHGAVAERPVSTYSIVARDADTGELGVAVQSHWFQVGRVVPWAESGVGAVATQSFVEASYGPKGLALMKQGLSAQEALDRLVAADEQRDVRQVAMVDSQGRAAAWTGSKCIREAGHIVGDGFTVQANLMDRASVWAGHGKSIQDTDGDLAERLLAAMEAAQAEGGDIRGKQSAAILVVRGKSTGESWQDRVVDLRIADHEQPLVELRRLLDLHRAYEAMNLGDEAMAEGKIEEANRLYSKAAALAPHIEELPFWKAVTLFAAGQEDEALPIFKQVFEKNADWARLIPRLPASGLLPDDPDKIKKILSVTEPELGHDIRPNSGGRFGLRFRAVRVADKAIEAWEFIPRPGATVLIWAPARRDRSCSRAGWGGVARSGPSPAGGSEARVVKCSHGWPALGAGTAAARRHADPCARFAPSSGGPVPPSSPGRPRSGNPTLKVPSACDSGPSA